MNFKKITIKLSRQCKGGRTREIEMLKVKNSSSRMTVQGLSQGHVSHVKVFKYLFKYVFKNVLLPKKAISSLGGRVSFLKIGSKTLTFLQTLREVSILYPKENNKQLEFNKGNSS